MGNDPLKLSREDYNAFARKQFPSPVLSIGWLQIVLNERGQQIVADILHLIDQKGKYAEVSGKSYGRPGGRCYNGFGKATYYLPGPNPAKVPPIFVMPDTALRMFEKFDGSPCEEGAGEMLLALLRDGGACTRIDVTMDLYGYEIHPYFEAYRLRDYSPWRQATSYDSSQDEGGGITIYFGTRGAGCSFVRMYEKGAERREPYAVLRVEPQLRHEMASQFATHAFKNAPSVLSGLASVFPSMLDFHKGHGAARGDAHRSRQELERYPEWQAVLDSLPTAIPFSVVLPESPP